MANVVYRNRNTTMKLFKGWWGEFKTKWALRLGLSYRYKVLNNILIRFKNGGSTQIDHIVISRYGIFVIETKHYRGIIKVKPNHKFWVQQIGGYNYEFYNPIRQNLTHITAIKNITQTTEHYIEGIINFTGDSVFENENEAYRYNVVHLKHLLATIECYDEKILSRKQVRQIYRDIQANSSPATFRNMRRHKKYVKSRQGRR